MIKGRLPNDATDREKESDPQVTSRIAASPPSSNVYNMGDWRQGLMNPDANINVDDDEGGIEIVNPDGSSTVIFDPNPQPINSLDDDHYENLAEKLELQELSVIAADLIDGIESDDRSRSEWLMTRAKGLDLLGIKIEQPRADIGGSGAPMDGMSTVRHPILLEACLRFQANARGELLPSDGPVKVKNAGLGTGENDTQADQLEEDLNRYLTSFDGAPEYYPDTDRMLFMTGFGGQGFKKLYHCPLRRRPVSESVDAKDLIVSNEATDLRNAERVTHVISMRKSVLKRMQFIGAYLDFELQSPVLEDNPVTRKEKRTQGLSDKSNRPQDTPYSIYECYTDRVIPGDEHRDESGRATGLTQPYKISIERASRKILEIRRNWTKDDENYTARRVFVPFSFVPMFGFYATGLLQILGNSTTALTAAWRILLDAGMFANFPGFLYALSGDRQSNLNFQVPPGGGAGVDIAGQEDIRNKIMALPYKEPGQATMSLVDNIASTAQRVGGTAEIQVGEGNQNAPVGTTIALLEQATQVLNAVHKRLYTAQAEEFQILLELFREDPESLFRFLKRDDKWTLETLQKALENYDLIPCADPNTPSHMFRIMRMQALAQLSSSEPDLYNAKAVHERILRTLRIEDPESLFAPPQAAQPAQQDPATAVAMAVAQTKQQETASRERVAMQTNQLKAADMAAKQKQADEGNRVKALQIASDQKKAADDRASREYVAKMNVAASIASKDIEHEHDALLDAHDKIFQHGQAHRDRQFQSQQASSNPLARKSSK